MHVVAESWARVKQLAEDAGRDPANLTLSIRLYLDPGAAMRPELSLQGSPEQMADTVGQWEELGVEHVLVDITAPGGPPGRLDALSTFMTGSVS